MKKSYEAGNTITLRLRKSDEVLMDWAAKQSELGDSLRYLIEQEVQKNGYKDLSLEIKNRRVVLPTSLEIEPELLKFICAKKSVHISEAYDEMAKVFQISEAEKNITVRDGESAQWQNNVRWARRFLKEKGYLKTNSERGIWELSAEGKKFCQ